VTRAEEIHATRKLIDAKVLTAHDDFMGETDGLLVAVCNGCGAARAKFDFVPDTIWGLCICSCCHIHDYGYFRGDSEEDRDREDDRFLMNLINLIEHRSSNWFMRVLRSRRAMSYYSAVREKGAAAFWAGKDRNEVITDEDYKNGG